MSAIKKTMGRPPRSDAPLIQLSTRFTDAGMKALEDLSELYGVSFAKVIERAVLTLRNDITQEQSQALETIRNIRGKSPQ